MGHIEPNSTPSLQATPAHPQLIMRQTALASKTSGCKPQYQTDRTISHSIVEKGWVPPLKWRNFMPDAPGYEVGSVWKRLRSSNRAERGVLRAKFDDNVHVMSRHQQSYVTVTFQPYISRILRSPYSTRRYGPSRSQITVSCYTGAG